MSYCLSAGAERDLDDILYTGIEMFGLSHAERYAQGFAKTFAFLADYPAAARLRTEIDPPAHAYPYKAHVIVYDVTDGRDIVIVRIRHSREDWLADARGVEI